MVLRFPRISSRVLQPLASFRAESPQEMWRQMAMIINTGHLEPGRGSFSLLLEGDTLEGITDGGLVIVFSKSLRPSVSTSVERSLQEPWISTL